MPCFARLHEITPHCGVSSGGFVGKSIADIYSEGGAVGLLLGQTSGAVMPVGRVDEEGTSFFRLSIRDGERDSENNQSEMSLSILTFSLLTIYLTVFGFILPEVVPTGSANPTAQVSFVKQHLTLLVVSLWHCKPRLDVHTKWWCIYNVLDLLSLCVTAPELIGDGLHAMLLEYFLCSRKPLRL